jgi:lambda family phage portal protein
MNTPAATTWHDLEQAPRKSSRVLAKFMHQQEVAKPGAHQRAGLSPVRLLEQRVPIRRNYAAATVNTLTQGWSTITSSANSDIFRSLDSLRARSRHLAQNDEYVKKWLSLVSTNVVGPVGFRLQARIYTAPDKPDDLANQAVEAGWMRFCKVCDVAGRQTFVAMCQTAIKSVARDGETLVQFVRGNHAGNPFGLALRLLDINRLDTNLNRPASTGMSEIRMGVELSQFGRPIAYHLRTRNPGDTYNQAPGQNLSTHERVLAEDIIHPFIVDDPEQVRGVPWAHAAMMRLNNRGGYEEAAIIAARVGASKMGFFTTPDGSAEPVSTGVVDDGSGDGNQPLVMDADAGSFQSLPEGVGFTPFNPDYPSAMFADFIKANLRGTASGLGVAYHALANDLEGVSFSSIRSGTLEERDAWMVIQQWFIDTVLERVFDEFLKAGLTNSLITMTGGSALPVSKIEKFRAHAWQARRWEWVDPRNDIAADIEAINAGLKSPQQVAAKLGLDYEDLLAEIARAQTMREKAGVKLQSEQQQQLMQQQLQQQQAPAAGQAGAANSEPKPKGTTP